MSDFIRDILMERHSATNSVTPFVFPSNSASGHVEEPKFPLRQIARTSGIEISAHDLRRTFMTVAESTDMSVLALKALVNHSLGGGVTEGYVQMATERLRVDTWVVTYLKCADTKLNRAIGRKVLIAAVHRARHPGCKFDNITVLESKEGWNKSTAIRIMAGDENFSDQSLLGASDKEVQEQLSGIWMHENADLSPRNLALASHEVLISKITAAALGG